VRDLRTLPQQAALRPNRFNPTNPPCKDAFPLSTYLPLQSHLQPPTSPPTPPATPFRTPSPSRWPTNSKKSQKSPATSCATARNSCTAAQNVRLHRPVPSHPIARRGASSSSHNAPCTCIVMADCALWLADKREFIKISQAVGVGFVVMGAIGYFVKLSMSRALGESG